MPESRELQLQLTLNDKMSSGLSSASSSLASFAKVGVAASAAAVAGLGATLAAAVKQASEFETKMANMATLISGDSTEAIDGLKDGILDLAKVIPKNANELGAAAYDVLSAGIEGTNEQLAVLEASGKLAVGGLGETSEAVDIVTSAINAFGIDANEANEVADSFFLAVKNGKTTVSQLSQGFGQIAPLANEVGVEFNELLASASALTTTGLQASVAYTQIRAALSNLLKPTEDMQTAFGILGITSDNLSQRLSDDGLINLFTQLKTVAEQNGIEMAKMFGSVEGLNAVLSLTGETGEKAVQIFEQMAGEAGMLDEAFAKQQQTVNNLWQILKNNLNVALIELGEVVLPPVIKTMEYLNQNVFPAVIKGVESLQWAFNNYNIIAEQTSQRISEILGIIESKTGLVTHFQFVWDMLRNAFVNDLMPAFNNLLQIILRHQDELRFLAGVVLQAVILAVKTFTFQLTLAVTTFSKLLNIITSVANFIDRTLTPVFNGIKNSIQFVIDKVQLLIQKLQELKNKGGVTSALTNAGLGVARNMLPVPFAKGGIVTGPTNALIGEAGPEAVIPLDKLKNFGGGGISVVVTGNNITSDTDLSELGEQVAESIMNKLRLNERLTFG